MRLLKTTQESFAALVDRTVLLCAAAAWPSFSSGSVEHGEHNVRLGTLDERRQAPVARGAKLERNIRISGTDEGGFDDSGKATTNLVVIGANRVDVPRCVCDDANLGPVTGIETCNCGQPPRYEHDDKNNAQ